MKDFPIYTCSDGIASLILREIPYRQEGYILLRSVFTDVPSLVRTCAGACRAAGAERIYCSGGFDLSAYPIHARLVLRHIATAALPETSAVAVPILPKERAQWTQLHRERFSAVAMAASCVCAENACWIEENGCRIGLGHFHGSQLDSFAALVGGKGQDCLCALVREMHTQTAELLCAVENRPAMRLYDRLGFSVGTLREVWHTVG